MSDFKKVLSETKTQLKEMLTKESSQEDIERITALDKKLDSLQEEYDKKSQENESLKDTLIESVKGTGFKVKGSQSDDSGVDGDQKSMDDIMNEELEKIVAKQNK